MTTSPVPSVWSRRNFLAAGAAGAALPFLMRVPAALAEAGPDPKAFGFPAADKTAKVVRPMAFPVEGTVNWTDTFGACRSGCSRAHEGQDLMGKKLQKLLACVDGTVVALRHETSGNSLYLQDADGWYYAYLHINNDTPNTDDGKNPREWAFVGDLKEGDKVTKGQHVAYMGDSGNAESSSPHCHFEVRRPAKDGVWKSQAVNPAPSLTAAKKMTAVATAAPTALAATDRFLPFASAATLVTQQYRDFLGRDPSQGSLDLYTSGLESKQTSATDVIVTVLDSTENQQSAGAVVRLYQAYFHRDPDMSGFNHWVEQIRRGVDLEDVSQAFTKSSEFVRTYGSLSNHTFVRTVYKNVLGRDSDPDGQAYWVKQLDRKLVGRGRLMLRFTESTENQAKLRNRVRLFLMNAQMLGVSPHPDLMTLGQNQLDRGAFTIEKLVETVRTGPDYAKRVG